ncbi:Fic family protein [Aquirufa ecclesiirivi]|uniref:Fic family protein n=1 Tax=Aquirufa ecclesiirivi TaxID=2715124 RepID=UPI003BAFFDF8
MSNTIPIWKPIEFDDIWLKCNTSKLDELAPSWFKKREKLKEGSVEYDDFLNKLKRQHAIETGIVEKLYNLKEGITQTFIKEGFYESYLQHGDTNIPPTQLIAYLKDHFEAIDFVFDVVNQNRTINKGFILELHSLITQNQHTTEAINSLGQIVNVELLKGQFKKFENNPQRADGSIFLYCPPIHVESEIEKLIKIYIELEEKNIKPVIISAWFHHSFTQIHPFQDGNGRLARLLASLILIKNKLFPFTVKGIEKKKYIDSLESADKGNPQLLVDFFCEVEKKNIEEVLNLNLESPISQKSLNEVAESFSLKLDQWKKGIQLKKVDKINNNRKIIFEYGYSILNEALNELKRKIPSETADLYFDKSFPDEVNKHYWFTHQIVDYAKLHSYYFNRALPRGWFKFGFVLSKDRQYHLVISIHHYGYDDSTIAAGAFLEFIENETNNNLGSNKPSNGYKREGLDNNLITSLPLDIKPHIMSLEANVDELKRNFESFLLDTLTLTLGHIASEIS